MGEGLRLPRPYSGCAPASARARFPSPITSSFPGNLLSGKRLNSSSQTIQGISHSTDLAFMAEARALGRLGAGRTWTNPMVGAVVVKDGEVIASAYHQRLGEPHAECLAFAAAGDRARGATLYVSLEPCAHQGRTPPCVEGILTAGIARVVIPAPDPDARVSGLGIEMLRARGVRVDVGCDAAAAILDNHGYYHNRLGVARTVTLKMATSRDGKVSRAPGQRDRVTGDAAQLDTHRLRAVNDAIVIGAETARIDRPRLDCRLLEAGVDREPATVVFDTGLSLADDATWPEAGRDDTVVCGVSADAARECALEKRGIRVVRNSARIVDALEKLGFARVLVEGGPRLMRSFIEAGTWDAFWHYEAKEEFGANGVSMGQVPVGTMIDELALDFDVRRRYVNATSWDRLIGGLKQREDGNVHGDR
ncbi:MAG TPA: bifunctional diaminohydroxyphosphoribosylaminopyrimidine deaminase/5-amino-6-(5-phosphoribosylamino)uracil reductase RibD [Candidatus Krumholzibacteria bacterium]|nr:bifunctional diaminohydroxyphosphoribosylaminopyrimidine deaminase/5-amino-6-(5-phosphoribosylamino)uracil reductase RibD [Candidatus Krumholzibacteria bacterium]